MLFPVHSPDMWVKRKQSMKHGLPFWCLLSALVSTRAVEADVVGSPAPALEPTEWLNTKVATSWNDLKGKLVLVEKWATW
jgi:hypothetical protein